MPLQDHFAPPLSRTHPWRGFHGAWAAAIARRLNEEILPAGYHAVPTVEFDGPAGGPAPWVPPAPPLSVALEWPPVDLVEVQVLYDEGGPCLTAAIELVSPSNKDRPIERRAFAVQCVNYLQQASSVVVVDTVTTRRASLHAEILHLLEVDLGKPGLCAADLCTVAYRAVKEEHKQQLQVWAEPLAIGQALPRMPLWIGSDVCVPLDLEASYLATCEDLRIR